MKSNDSIMKLLFLGNVKNTKNVMSKPLRIIISLEKMRSRTWLLSRGSPQLEKKGSASAGQETASYAKNSLAKHRPLTQAGLPMDAMVKDEDIRDQKPQKLLLQLQKMCISTTWVEEGLGGWWGRSHLFFASLGNSSDEIVSILSLQLLQGRLVVVSMSHLCLLPLIRKSVSSRKCFQLGFTYRVRLKCYSATKAFSSSNLRLIRSAPIKRGESAIHKNGTVPVI